MNVSGNCNSSLKGGHSHGHDSQPWPENVVIPESFLCALTKRLMKHPVIDREGNSYERDAISNYLQHGRGYSPVTKNPLQESDLVDNKGLQMAIDAALKSAIEQEHTNQQSTKKPRTRRFRLSLSASMKTGKDRLAMRIGKRISDGNEDDFLEEHKETTSTRISRGQSEGKDDVLEKSPSGSDREDSATANRHCDQSKSKRHSVDYSLKTESSAEDFDAPSDWEEIYPWEKWEGDRKLQEEESKPILASSIALKQQHTHHSHTPNNGRRNPRKARGKGRDQSSMTTGDARLDAGIAAFMQSAELGTSLTSERRSDDFKTQQTNGTAKDNSAFDKFERRLKKKLTQDSGTAKYVPKTTMVGSANQDELLKKKLSQDSGTAKYVPKSTMVGSANQDELLKKKLSQDSVTAKYVPKSTMVGTANPVDQDCPVKPKDDELYKEAIVVLWRTPEQEEALKLKEFRGKLRRKLCEDEAAIAESKKQQSMAVKKKGGDVGPASRFSLRNIREDNTAFTHSHTNGNCDTRNGSLTSGAGMEEEVDYVQLQKDRKRTPENRRSMLDKKLSMRSIKVTSGAGVEEEVDYVQLQEDRKRTPENRRSMLDQKLSMRSIKVTKTKEEASRKNPSLSSEDSCDTFEPALKVETGIARLQDERHRKQRNRRILLNKKVEHLKASCESAQEPMSRNGKKNPHKSIRIKKFASSKQISDLTIDEVYEDSEGESSLPKTFDETAERSNSLVSWGDMDEELECAQFLSMKIANDDAMELQCALETSALSDGEVDSVPSHEKGQGKPVIAEQGSRMRRGQSNQENLASSELSDEVDALLPVVEGSGKTRFDVVHALRFVNGDKDKALAMLLGFENSFERGLLSG